MITIDSKNDLRESSEKILYAEIMGKYSNIILVENGKILGALKQSTLDEGNLRPIFCGLSYILPLSQEKTEITDFAACKNMFLNYQGGDAGEFLFNNFKGLAKSTAREVIHSYTQKNNGDDNFIKTFKTNEFIEYFQSFYVAPKFLPNIVIAKKPVDFFITEYASIEGEKIYFNSITEAIDKFYQLKNNIRNFNLKHIKLLSAVTAYEKKQSKLLQIVLEKKLACQDADKNRLMGEIILSNLYQLKEPTEKFIAIDYTSPDYKEIEIKLDKTVSPKANAEKLFKKYNKQKKTLQAITPQEQEITIMLDYLKGLIIYINQTKNIEELTDIEEELIAVDILKVKSQPYKRKQKPSAPRRFEYNGFEILVGRNNIQNDSLTLSSDKSDMFLHTKDYHSAHVIIKSNNRVIPDSVILYAAELCAYYSEAREGTKVPVDYTLKKYVKKINTFIGKVSYTDQKTILVTPSHHN